MVYREPNQDQNSLWGLRSLRERHLQSLRTTAQGVSIVQKKLSDNYLTEDLINTRRSAPLACIGHSHRPHRRLQLVAEDQG